MDAWDYYKKSVGSIRGQLNTNREAISSSLTQRGYGPQDDVWASRMDEIYKQANVEEDIVQQSSIAKRLRSLAASIPDIVGPTPTQDVLDQASSKLANTLGRQAYPWELKLEGLERYTP